MTRLLPALHEGHAPIQLHYAFEDAAEAFEGWLPGSPEPDVLLDGKRVPVSAVFGRMRTCSDILPQRTLELVRDVIGDVSSYTLTGDRATYAGAAFVLRAMCVERLGSEPARRVR